MLIVKSIINTVLESRTYILEVSRTEFWIVDPGDIEQIMETAGDGKVLKGILLIKVVR